MGLDFDSDSSLGGNYTSPEEVSSDEDDDYNLEEEDDDELMDPNLASNDATTGKAFPANSQENDWLSTQPASQSSPTKKRRISPRRKTPIGITGAIVGAIQGDIDSLVIPKKKKFQTQSSAAATNHPQTIPPSAAQVGPTDQQQQQQQHPPRKQPPMKKRKVSLSPTDSLARQRPAAKQEEVIDLLADDDDDDDDNGDNETLACKRSRMMEQEAQDKLLPQRLSPALLAAATKQQKEHVQATKQKQKKNATNEKSPKDELPSKVSEVSYAEQAKKNPVSASAASSSATTKNDKPKTKASKSKGTKTKKATAAEPKSAEPNTKAPAAKAAASAVVVEPKSASTKSNAKTAKTAPKTVAAEPKSAATNSKVKAPKSNNEDKNALATSTKPSKAAAAPKPPPKKKKKRITFEQELLQKMFLTCRPYSIKDLIQLMGKTASEASVNFCLLSLVDKKWVLKKEFQSGSRTKELYWANQESKDKKLWALECLQLPNYETIRQGRMELASLQQQHKNVFRETEEIERTPSNQQLAVLCEKAQTEVNDLVAKLEAMKQRISSSSGPPQGMSKFGNHPRSLGGNRFSAHRKPQQATKKATPLQLKKRVNAMRDHWIKRKRKCMDFVEALADGMEKKVKDVVHKVLELETDEAEHAVLPPKHIV